MFGEECSEEIVCERSVNEREMRARNGVCGSIRNRREACKVLSLSSEESPRDAR
jgi:hypothetical protein